MKMKTTAGRTRNASPAEKPGDLKALREFASLVRKSLGDRLIDIRLFGSRARGDARTDSDYDVLVLVQHSSAEVSKLVLAAAFDLGLEHEVYISPRIIEKSVIDDPVWRTTSFVKAIEKEGVPI